jgi:hypothetical protein
MPVPFGLGQQTAREVQHVDGHVMANTRALTAGCIVKTTILSKQHKGHTVQMMRSTSIPHDSAAFPEGLLNYLQECLQGSWVTSPTSPRLQFSFKGSLYSNNSRLPLWTPTISFAVNKVLRKKMFERSQPQNPGYIPTIDNFNFDR